MHAPLRTAVASGDVRCKLSWLFQHEQQPTARMVIVPTDTIGQIMLLLLCERVKTLTRTLFYEDIYPAKLAPVTKGDDVLCLSPKVPFGLILIPVCFVFSPPLPPPLPGRRRQRAALRMVAAETEAAAPATTTGPSPVGAPLRVGMFGGGTVGGGVYEICEQVTEHHNTVSAAQQPSLSLVSHGVLVKGWGWGLGIEIYEAPLCTFLT